MTCIFAMGAAVGLAATWWMSKPADTPPAAAAVRKFEPVTEAPAAKAANTASASVTAATGPAAGINPGELPYDGNPAGASVDASPATIAAPTQKTDGKELPRTAAVPQNASRAKPGSAEPVAPLVTTPPPAPKKAEQVVAEAPGSKAPTAPPAKVQETKVAKAPPRHRTPQKVAKDKEIERIQQQADDELKKKSRGGDVIEVARSRTEYTDKKAARQTDDNAPSNTAGHGSKRIALARCERDEDSLIGREWCKWKVCSGMWGKNGCPSYETQVSSHY